VLRRSREGRGDYKSWVKEGVMLTILAITVSFLVFLVLVGLLAQRADRIRDEDAQGEADSP
jgi:hypothetical protein